ncbi:substrate-binding domain-containing protein [Microtetraspora fusca]|uniref:substrate-binding domain-containing protein n=1 Tax=Microtetraspora fusca TaxID=1997 RepID=UPI00357157FF
MERAGGRARLLLAPPLRPFDVQPGDGIQQRPGVRVQRVAEDALSSPNRPTAIVYDNDIMAVAGLSVAQEMRLDVPADLSIVAWDDSPLSQVVRPPLTALSRDIPAYGAHAARRLLALIDGAEPGPLEDDAARLTPRGSTAPPPES